MHLQSQGTWHQSTVVKVTNCFDEICQTLSPHILLLFFSTKICTDAYILCITKHTKFAELLNLRINLTH